MTVFEDKSVTYMQNIGKVNPLRPSPLTVHARSLHFSSYRAFPHCQSLPDFCLPSTTIFLSRSLNDRVSPAISKHFSLQLMHALNAPDSVVTSRAQRLPPVVSTVYSGMSLPSGMIPLLRMSRLLKVKVRIARGWGG